MQSDKDAMYTSGKEPTAEGSSLLRELISVRVKIHGMCKHTFPVETSIFDVESMVAEKNLLILQLADALVGIANNVGYRPAIGHFDIQRLLNDAKEALKGTAAEVWLKDLKYVFDDEATELKKRCQGGR